ncbi:MAG: prepilin peptidase [Anaerolineae bacterium]
MIADPGATVALGAYAAVLAAAAWTDLRSRRIPNRLTFPAIAVAFTVAAISGHLITSLAGAALGAAVFILPIALYGPKMAGGGDVKLAAFIGAALGVASTVTALLYAGLAASAVVLAGLATRRLKRRQAIPFGPFLALGGVLALFLT